MLETANLLDEKVFEDMSDPPIFMTVKTQQCPAVQSSISYMPTVCGRVHLSACSCLQLPALSGVGSPRACIADTHAPRCPSLGKACAQPG